MFKNKYISLYKNGSTKPLLGQELCEVTVAQGVGGDVKILTEKRYFLGCSTRFEAKADLELQLCEGSGLRDQLPNPEPLQTKPSFSNPRNQGA